MKKNIFAYFLILFTATNAFAQYGDLSPGSRMADIPTNTWMRANEEIIISYMVGYKSGGGYFRSFFDDGEKVNDEPNGTICWLHTDEYDDEKLFLVAASGGVTIPKDTLMKVDNVFAKKYHVFVQLFFDHPVQLKHAVVDNITVGCYLGTGGWWANSDEAVHLDNMMYNLGGIIGILTAEEVKEIEERKAAAIAEAEKKKKEEVLKKKFPLGVEEIKHRLAYGCTVWIAEHSDKEIFLITSESGKPTKVKVLNWNNGNQAYNYALKKEDWSKNTLDFVWVGYENSFDPKKPHLTIYGILNYSDFDTHPSYDYFGVGGYDHIQLTGRTCNQPNG